MVKCSKCGAYMPVIQIETNRTVYYCHICNNYQTIPPQTKTITTNNTSTLPKKKWRVTDGTEQR